MENIEIPQPVEQGESKIYLLTFLEVDGERHISIEAENILIALEKFAQQYKEICGDWDGISLNVQRIESI